MSIRVPVSLFRLLLCGLLVASSGALAQTPSGQTPSGQTLQAPQKQKVPAASEPSKPHAAPRTPVHRVAPKPPPVIKPHGPAHAQKPTAKPPAAAPAPAAPAAPPPAPAAEPEKPAAENKGPATGLPLPRFAALRTDEVNLRAGPGTRYPIEWIYRRRELPVQIQREFEVWRLVQDPDGIKGWVHSATLTGRRSFIVTGADATLRREPQDGAGAVAILKPGVVGHIRTCPANADWCQVQVSDYRGFLKRSQFWGSPPGEVVAN